MKQQALLRSPWLTCLLAAHSLALPSCGESAADGGTSGAGGGGPIELLVQPALDCQALHPDRGASGDPSTGHSTAPHGTLACYTPDASERAAGCLLPDSPRLLDDGHLNVPNPFHGLEVLSVHSDALPSAGVRQAMPACCEAVADDGDRRSCQESAESMRDESGCAQSLAHYAPSCSLPPATRDQLVCCYTVCGSTYGS